MKHWTVSAEPHRRVGSHEDLDTAWQHATTAAVELAAASVERWQDSNPHDLPNRQGLMPLQLDVDGDSIRLFPGVHEDGRFDQPGTLRVLEQLRPSGAQADL